MGLSSQAPSMFPDGSKMRIPSSEGIVSARSSVTVQPPSWRQQDMFIMAAAIFLSVTLLPVAASAQAKSSKGAVYEQLNLFGEAFDRIRQDAVEPVTEAKLIGAAIAGMLSGLDARSAYIGEAAFRAMQTPANEDQASLGLAVTIENGQLKVIAPQGGSPAAQAGIKPGDLIYAI